jgi:predicted RNase H-like HicB family nuclease
LVLGTGVHSREKKIQELKENLKEAIQLIIESNLKRFTYERDEYIEKQITVTI